MDGLQFQDTTPLVRSDPARADIGCFVGFVSARRTGDALRADLEQTLRALGWNGPSLPAASRVLPDVVVPAGESSNAFVRWLERLGWRPDAHAVSGLDLFRRAAARLLGDALVEWWHDYAWTTPIARRSAADLLELFDVPIPVDTWDTFDALLAWDRRLLGDVDASVVDSTLGVAVRRFFLQGGRKCYVVRLGDPAPLFTRRVLRSDLRSRFLHQAVMPSPMDRVTWRGVAHLFGLPDVSFVNTPDLPELCAVEPAPLPMHVAAATEERFIECATRTVPETSRSLRAYPAPRCDEAGFEAWAACVRRIGGFIEHNAREVQYVAAVPLPVDPDTLRTHPDLVTLPAGDRVAAARARLFDARTEQWRQVGSIETAFVQLAYPWLRTRESRRLPGALEPPDAMLTGMLAGNALTAGTWRTVAREPAPAIGGVEPLLSTSDLEMPLLYAGDLAQRRTPRTLRERVSLFGPSPTGFQLLSDVTSDDDEAYRPAAVNRLVASIVRAARLTGEDVVFENNGEAVWRHLRAALESVLMDLWGEGALDGATARDAFDVRCDRSTMTQADLDAGRVIARVQFTAATPVQRIIVLFAMDEGGRLELAAAEPALA